MQVMVLKKKGWDDKYGYMCACDMSALDAAADNLGRKYNT